MASPENSSHQSKQPAHQAEVPKEEEEDKEAEKEAQDQPPPSIDPRLVAALQHPRISLQLLHMESEIQQLMANPDSLQVQFPQCRSNSLRMLASALAIHYGLEPDCTQNTIVYARKKPDSRIPSVTLSDIAECNPVDKPTIPIEKGSAGASSSNFCAPEMTEPVSNLSAPEKSEPEKAATTLEEREKGKPTSNMSAQETTEMKNRDRTADEPDKTEPGKGATTLEEKEKKPLTVDKRLADAVQHPKFGKILLSTEAKIQEAIQNPKLQEVEFPQCTSSYLRRLAGILSLHYGLEPHCTESIRVFATKKPDSRIPSVTLSGIATRNPGDKLTIPIEKDSAGASSSNLCAPEMTIPEEGARILEEREDLEPNCNLSVPELTESEKRARTLEEEEQPTANMVYAQEMTEAEKRKEEKPINNLSAQERTESEKDARTLEERKEEEPLTIEERDEDVESPILVDPCLADAVQDPEVRNILLSIEAKIQQVIQNPNLQEIEFPECSSSHLVTLSSILALHYGLEPHYRVYATKKPESRIPSVTLSGIPKIIPKATTDIPKDSSYKSASVSSSTSPVVSRSMPPAVSRCIPSSVSNSMSPVVSSSNIPPVISDSRPVVDSSSISPVVSSSVSQVVSNFIPPVVESSTLVASLSPVISSSISAVVSNSIPTEASSLISTVCNRLSTGDGQDDSSGEHPQEMQYRESISQCTSSSHPQEMQNTESVSQHATHPQEMQNTESVSQHATHPQEMQNTESVSQHATHPQEMQYTESVSQPASTSPYMLTPYGNYNMYYPYYPYYASGAMHYPNYPYYAPEVPFFPQQPPVQYGTQPYHASGANLAYSSSMQCPPVQYLATYAASEAMYNQAYSSYNQWSSAQYTQSSDTSSQYGATPSSPRRSSRSSVRDTNSEQYLSEQ